MSYKIQFSIDYMSNGCDCCEPTEWPTWEVLYQDETLCSFTDISDALQYILEKQGITVEIDYGE